MNDFREYSNYLKHYGVKGMHWGVRRYQNKDGSYTEAGKKRYKTSFKEKIDFIKAIPDLIRNDTYDRDMNKVKVNTVKDIEKLKFDKNLKSVGGIPKEYIDMGKEAFKSVAKDPRFILASAAAIVPGLISLGKMAYRRIKKARENRRKMTTTYDRRTDQYVKLKRPLTAEEQKELAKRMRKGETKTMILEEMNLLK